MIVTDTDILRGPAGVQRVVVDGTHEWSIYGTRAAYACNVIIVDEGDGYSAHVANLPGAVSEGETIDEALTNIRDALGGLLPAYSKRGQIPWADAKVEGEIACEKRIIVNV
ncbi:MAG: type II toxin-antitoxin system HicB family antitoxin [Planctomycetaceae bacterium]